MRYEKTEQVIEEGRARERARKNAVLRALINGSRNADCTYLLRGLKGLNVKERTRKTEVKVIEFA